MKFNRVLNLDTVIRNCVICNSADHYNFEVVDNLKFTNTHSICSECGLCFMNPMYTEKAYLHFYDGLYERYYGVKALSEISKGCKGDQIGNFIKKNIPSAKSVYEIGCGAGQNLAALRDYHNFKVSGCEPSKQACLIANEKFNLKIENKGSNNFEKKKIKNIDVICLLDVIEHLFDPLETLKKIYKYITNGKYLVIETLALDIEYPPKGIQGYFRIPHPFNFTTSSLKNLIEKSGFEIKKTTILGRGLIRILAEKNSNFKIKKDFRSKENVLLCINSLRNKKLKFIFYKIKTFPFRIIFLIYNILLIKFLKQDNYKVENDRFYKFLRSKQVFWD